MDNCKYNKIKLLHELSSIAWFLEKCAIKDAEKNGCCEPLKALKKDLEKHISMLEELITKSH